jgi:hypothetical protein
MPEQIARRTPTYLDHSGEIMTERLAVGGPDPVPLSEVLAALVDAGGVSGVVVHTAFFSWMRRATDEEHQHYLDLQENQRQRTEKWEREMLVRLTAKYGTGDGR